MNIGRRAVVWFTGHRVGAVAVAEEDIGGLTKIAPALFFAATLSALNMAVFFCSFAPAWLSRWLVASCGAVFGAGVVLAFDRAMLYFIDTQFEGEHGKWALRSYIALRVLMILGLGAFTSQAIMPVLLGPELKAHALAMQEASGHQRSKLLHETLALDDKKARVQDAQAGLKQAEAAVQHVPEDIQAAIKQGQSCWVRLQAWRNRLRDQGNSATEIAERTGGQRQRCAQIQNDATKARDAYMAGARQSLAQAREDAQGASTRLREGEQTAERKLKAASEVEAEAYTPNSSEVLHSLLKSSPGALTKWCILTFLQVTFELLPLLLKLQAGQSPLGAKLGALRQAKLLAARRYLQDARLHAGLSESLADVSADVAHGLANSASLRRDIEAELARVAKGVAPLHTVTRFMDEVRQAESSVSEGMRRHPGLASQIGDAWHQALARAVAAVGA